MKTLPITLVALCLHFTLTTQARAQNDSPLNFSTTEHNFGTIGEQNGPVGHTFRFTNSAEHPIAIDRVTASCGCTTPNYPTAPIAPGADGKIDVVFDPMGMPGEFAKTITVISGGGKHHNVLTINGSVAPKPKTVEEEFPDELARGVRISTTMLAFGPVAQGRAKTMTAEVINTSGRDVDLGWVLAAEGSGMMVAEPKTIPAGERQTVNFTYDLSEKTAYGQFYDLVRATIDGSPGEADIYTAATGVDDFEGVEIAAAARFFLNTTFHNFGEIRRRAVPYTFRLVASNEGAGELHIRSVIPTEGLQTTLRAGMTIAPGAELPFEVMLYTSRLAEGELQGAIRLVVGDPIRPTRDIRVAAIIK